MSGLQVFISSSMRTCAKTVSWKVTFPVTSPCTSRDVSTIVNYSFQQLRLVFVFWGDQARLFIRHIKSVKRISTKFEFVKISRHSICNWIFLILCLILASFCLFIFLLTHSDSSSSVEHSSTMMPFDSSLSV